MTLYILFSYNKNTVIIYIYIHVYIYIYIYIASFSYAIDYLMICHVFMFHSLCFMLFTYSVCCYTLLIAITNKYIRGGRGKSDPLPNRL